jgi:hypothetical protein
MPRFQRDDATSETMGSKAARKRIKKRFTFFVANESGLYAFTTDREGRMLPSQIYPRLHWRFEQAITVSVNGTSARDKILKVALEGIAKRGFHLLPAALYGELLGFTAQSEETPL